MALSRLTAQAPLGLFIASTFPRYMILRPIMYMTSPYFSGWLPVSIRPFTKVPLTLPRSRSSAPPSINTISACFGEANWFPYRMMLPSPLPIEMRGITEGSRKYLVNWVLPSVTSSTVREKTCPSGSSQFSSIPA